MVVIEVRNVKEREPGFYTYDLFDVETGAHIPPKKRIAIDEVEALRKKTHRTAIQVIGELERAIVPKLQRPVRIIETPEPVAPEVLEEYVKSFEAHRHPDVEGRFTEIIESNASMVRSTQDALEAQRSLIEEIVSRPAEDHEHPHDHPHGHEPVEHSHEVPEHDHPPLEHDHKLPEHDHDFEHSHPLEAHEHLLADHGHRAVDQRLDNLDALTEAQRRHDHPHEHEHDHEEIAELRRLVLDLRTEMTELNRLLAAHAHPHAHEPVLVHHEHEEYAGAGHEHARAGSNWRLLSEEHTGGHRRLVIEEA